jgi:hypothetical protein
VYVGTRRKIWTIVPRLKGGNIRLNTRTASCFAACEVSVNTLSMHAGT